MEAGLQEKVGPGAFAEFSWDIPHGPPVLDLAFEERGREVSALAAVFASTQRAPAPPPAARAAPPSAGAPAARGAPTARRRGRQVGGAGRVQCDMSKLGELPLLLLGARALRLSVTARGPSKLLLLSDAAPGAPPPPGAPVPPPPGAPREALHLSLSLAGLALSLIDEAPEAPAPPAATLSSLASALLRRKRRCAAAADLSPRGSGSGPPRE